MDLIRELEEIRRTVDMLHWMLNGDFDQKKRHGELLDAVRDARGTLRRLSVKVDDLVKDRLVEELSR